LVMNGMGCAAAQLVEKLKDGPGNIYLREPGLGNCLEQYVYDIYEKSGQICVRVRDIYGDTPTVLFDGNIEKFDTDGDL